MRSRVAPLFRFWWTFESPVDRRAYWRHGLGLTALKYTGDVALVGATTGTLWSPVDYFSSVPFLMSHRLEGAPPWLMPALAVWTLPFLWAGITLTLRRAVDAGFSAWYTVVFFLPYFNYLLMVLLCLLPSAAMPQDGVNAPRPHEARLPSAMMAIAVGLAVGLLMLLLSVAGMQRYGLGLFFGTPFAIGASTAFLFNRRYPASRRETFEVVAMTFALVAGVAIALGSEGAVCLIMALPLGLVVGIMGAAVGRAVALRGSGNLASASLALMVLPAATALEPVSTSGVSLHEVRSAVVIDAAPERVWPHVIAFRPLPAPTDLAFRLGIAYPRYARIEGSGVGAVRYCVFSTGPFVEPITAWEPGRRLAFDVVRSPDPLRELTPYAGIAPPHLDGYLRSERGEFRLVALPDGRTRLEGSTWYRLELAPEPYWQVISDHLIHLIHLRVLEHIKRETELGTALSQP